jgi:hypothetical protein
MNSGEYAGRHAPPALLPGRSARRWLRYCVVGLATVPLAVPLVVVGAAASGTVFGHIMLIFTVLYVVVFVLSLGWCDWSFEKRRRLEAAAGYMTIASTQKEPHLWYLDDVTGDVRAAPTVIIAEPDSSLIGQRVNNAVVVDRVAFRRQRLRRAMKLVALAIPAALLGVYLFNVARGH